MAELTLTPEQVAEISLVDLAYAILKQTNKPFHYRDLMQEVARVKGLTDEEVNNVIARLYTEINIDGRFICIGANVWGLKRWYPTYKTADAKAAGGKKFVRKDVDEDDFYDDEDDEVYPDEEELDDDAYSAFDDEDVADDDEVAADFDDEDPVLDEDEVAEADADEEDLDSYDDEEEEF